MLVTGRPGSDTAPTHARLGNKAEALKRPLVTEKATYQSDVQLIVKQLES